jgi:hypothetical protein
MFRSVRFIFIQIVIGGQLFNSAWCGADIPPTEDGKPLVVYLAFGIIDIYDISDCKQNKSISLAT